MKKKKALLIVRTMTRSAHDFISINSPGFWEMEKNLYVTSPYSGLFKKIKAAKKID